MRIAVLTPWKNVWLPYYQTAIERRGHEFSAQAPADVVLHMWSSGATQPLPGARNVFFLRRYELFDNWGAVRWQNVDALIVVNSWIRDVVQRQFKEHALNVPVHLVYNGTDLNRWKFKPRVHGQRIGMACHVHPKKNLPLALQILRALPESYALHIAGEVQDTCTAEYLNDMGGKMRRKVYIYGHIDNAEMNLWWEQMNYCLSTSISEGNPNNVIEAMAKGVKPIVHDWPGADDQFPDDVRFRTAAEACALFDGPYQSQRYRDIVQDKFSLANIERVLDIAIGEAH